jgi:hypothetical protein
MQQKMQRIPPLLHNERLAMDDARLALLDDLRLALRRQWTVRGEHDAQQTDRNKALSHEVQDLSTQRIS